MTSDLLFFLKGRGWLPTYSRCLLRYPDMSTKPRSRKSRDSRNLSTYELTHELKFVSSGTRKLSINLHQLASLRIFFYLHYLHITLHYFILHISICYASALDRFACPPTPDMYVHIIIHTHIYILYASAFGLLRRAQPPQCRQNHAPHNLNHKPLTLNHIAHRIMLRTKTTDNDSHVQKHTRSAQTGCVRVATHSPQQYK